MKSQGALPPLLRLIGRLSGFTLLLLNKGMLAEASRRPPRPPHTLCVPLQGIESGGTPDDAGLDLDVIKVALVDEAFNPFTSIIPIVAGCSAGLETPIAMRNLLAIDTAAFSISSAFHPNMRALDIFGDKHTSDSRRRCQPDEGDGDDGKLLLDLHLRVAITYLVAYAGATTMPDCFEALEATMEERGHPLSLILEGEPSVDTPWGIAKAYFDEVMAFLDENDGWNADGSMSRDHNRVPFSDFAMTDSAGNSWTPYEPVNSPYKLRRGRRWQPLMESNGFGYITVQEHVTPHIGVTARFFGFDSQEDEEAFASRKLDRPDYRHHYNMGAKEVIEEARITAEDVSRQQAIAFFDNKFGSLVPLKAAYFVQHADEFPAIEFYRITAAAQLAVYNGIVLAWREKVRHDLPRPPTVVKQKLGDRLVETYAGPGEGVQSIKASEWEPFIRIMPHSEFPSASSCLCQVFTEQVEEYFGIDEISPPLELGPFSYTSWSEISQVCGDSRVWGGMHFKDAVPAGVELCGGGDMAVSIAKSIDRLIEGDEEAAVFKADLGELFLRPL